LFLAVSKKLSASLVAHRVFPPKKSDHFLQYKKALSTNVFFYQLFEKCLRIKTLFTSEDFVTWPTKSDCKATQTAAETDDSARATMNEYRALFASMICTWSEGSDCAITVGAKTIKYNSKGVEDGIVLDTSDRYEQRLCNDKDTSGDKWTSVTSGVTTDDPLYYDVVHTLHRTVDGTRTLCNNNGESLTSPGTKNSMFPMQQ
jgi:hypothetical protein